MSASPNARQRSERQMDHRVDVSVVIPAYNERDSLEQLSREISDVLHDLNLTYEIIVVDDGSTDGTDQEVRRLSALESRIRLITLARNFGKSTAYMAGFRNIRGRIVVTLDADLQDDPAEIPHLLSQMHDDQCDLVTGWKQGRIENEPTKALPSKLFNYLTAVLFRVYLHDMNCGFRVMRAEVAKSLHLYGHQYRFIPQLAHVKGYKVSEAPVNHRKRRFGVSKYGPTRFWTGLLDLITVRFITAFGERPLHFFGTFGLVPFVLGGVIELYVLIAKVSGDTFREHVAAIIIGAMLIVMGFQCILIGLVAEMLSAPERASRHVGSGSDSP